MSHVEAQIQFAKDEIQGLRTRRQSLEDALERIKSYTVRCMEGLEVKKLEGRTVTLSLRCCPQASSCPMKASCHLHTKRRS